MSNTTSGPTFEVHFSCPQQSKGEREYQAFLRLLPQLLTTHRGKYLAIHEEQVVDSDTDEVALILRVQARVGYVPLYVGRVVEEQPLVRARALLGYLRPCHRKYTGIPLKMMRKLGQL